MVNKANVLKVANAIEKAARPRARPKLGFNMVEYFDTGRPDQTGHACGTTACIAGWSRAIEEGRIDLQWDGDGDWRLAREFLGISDAQAEKLFLPTQDEAGLWRSEITASHAVATLRHLAETGKVDWSVSP